jgi:Mg/Co/Ni transporter MgtE
MAFTSNPTAPADPDDTTGPLTELTESLAAGDLAAAAAILRDTAWPNVTNILRALPESHRVTVIALLEPETANQVLHELSDEEVARLRNPQPKPAGEG